MFCFLNFFVFTGVGFFFGLASNSLECGREWLWSYFPNGILSFRFLMIERWKVMECVSDYCLIACFLKVV